MLVDRSELLKESSRVTHEAQTAHALFRFFDTRGVTYAVLGDVRDYEETISSDIDIVVSPRDLDGIPRLLGDFCNEHEGKLIQVLRHEASAWYYVLVFTRGGERYYLHPDVCSDYYRRGRLLLSADELLSKRYRGEAGFWLPGAGEAFAYYLLKKVDKGCVDANQFEYLVETRRIDVSGADSWVRRIWSNGVGDELIAGLRNADYRQFQSCFPRLRSKLSTSIRPVCWRARLAELGRVVCRICQPTGAMLIFLGPDGVGKSSVISEVELRVAPAFRRTRRFHLRPHFGRCQKNVGPLTQPHGLEPRNVVSSVAKVFLWWSDFNGGYISTVFPQLVRSTLVLFDRYVDDLAIDPRRYRYGGPLWLARILTRLVPRADLAFVLVADASVIQARKSEMPISETARQVEMYRELTERKGMVLVDADRPLEDVVSDIVDITFEWLEDRTCSRLCLSR